MKEITPQKKKAMERLYNAILLHALSKRAMRALEEFERKGGKKLMALMELEERKNQSLAGVNVKESGPRLKNLGLDLSPARPPGAQVIKVGGGELDDPAFVAQFAESIARMKRAGAQPIIVHGGGKALTQLLAMMDAPTQFVDGLRVTDARTRDAALMVLSGLANKKLVAALIGRGVDAVGLSGLDAGLIRVERFNDALGFVGRPVSARASLIAAWLAQGLTPVIAPMSLGADGEIYNVNADHVAGAIAVAVDAGMLTFVTNVPGVLGPDRSLIPHLSAAQVEAMIADGAIFGGMIPKVRAALEALDAGVRRVRITDLGGLAGDGGTVFTRPTQH